MRRRLLPDEHAADPGTRSGAGRWRAARTLRAPAARCRRTFTTGYRYAGLGYTTAFDAAVAPLTARHSHSELDDTPIVDGGFYVLMGNDEYLLRQIEAGREQPRPRLCGLDAGLDRRLRDQGRESRRCRGVEVGTART